MDKLLSCDWGTSSFRLRLVNIADGEVLTKDSSDMGIADYYQQWQAADKAEDRLNFYMAFINRRIAVMEKQMAISLQQLPLIISGMASSSIGMKALAYKMLPFATDGSDLIVDHFEDKKTGGRPVFLVSGARTADDVMRGEETLLAGAINDTYNEEQIFIFPGTHSKHIQVLQQQAIAFQTFMTGEFFDLLANKSILAHAIAKPAVKHASALAFFEKGVQEAKTSNFLNSCFHIRTSNLFNQSSSEENYYYLSGLLIGCELNALPKDIPKITLVSDGTLLYFYQKALEILLKNTTVSVITAGKALVRGQLKIYHSINHNL